MDDLTPQVPRPRRFRKGDEQPGASPLSGLSNRARNWLTVGIVCVAFLILFVIFDSWMMPALTRQGQEFELVDLQGKNSVEAEKKLTEQGLTMEVTSREYNPAYPNDAVLSQYPPPGTMVKPGRLIKVVTSLGEKDVIIPQVAGVSVRQAKLDIETAGLELGDIAWTYTDTLPEKLVVFTYPAPGTKAPIGSKVNLLVNRGRGQGATFMPHLIGLTLDEAKELLRKKGLRVGLVVKRRDENFLPETVLEQSEEEATELEVGEEIDLVVSITD